MTILVPFVLIGWIPANLVIFQVLPPRRAVIVAFVFGWLFLPQGGYDLPGLPAYSRYSATGLGVLLATIVFHSEWLTRTRPLWVDLPMAVWCLCPIASSLSNGLGLYDGLSTAFGLFVMWGLPYFLGRVYFTRLEHLRELAIGVAVGGLIYAPLCAWELRMSPNLHRYVYGFDTGWGEVLYSGYRPKVFMRTGLELVMWMSATSLTGVWLGAGGALKRLGGYPFQGLLLGLVAVTVLCRGTGATLLLCMGAGLWFALKWTNTRLPALVLLSLGPLYIVTRTLGIWSGAEALELVRTVINERRAQSLETRLLNENVLAWKALQQPVFGWGGWNRARVLDEQGNDRTITDGMWIIALGNHGVVGLASFAGSLLLPMAIMVKRYPVSSWRHPSLVPAGAFATLANLYLFDCIANAMINPVYLVTLGGVLGVLDNLGTTGVRASFEALPVEGSSTREVASARRVPATIGARSGPETRASTAIRYGRLARSLKEQGRIREAEAAWLSALRTWSQLTAEFPDVPEYRRRWLDGHNDLAWLLLTTPGSGPRDVSRAILLSEKAVEQDPECGSYWNTLGIAYYRSGDWKAAIAALDHSIEFGGGGTSFDYFFLGMAHWQQGDETQAIHCCVRGDEWMEKNRPDHPDLINFRAEAANLLGGRSSHG